MGLSEVRCGCSSAPSSERIACKDAQAQARHPRVLRTCVQLVFPSAQKQAVAAAFAWEAIVQQVDDNLGCTPKSLQADRVAATLEEAQDKQAEVRHPLLKQSPPGTIFGA